MRKDTLLIALLTILFGIPTGANAQQVVVSSAKKLLQPQEVKVQNNTAPPTATLSLAAKPESMSLYTGTLKEQPRPKQGKAATTVRRVAKKVSSASDLAGTYVWTSSSLTGNFEGGHSVIVSALGTDSLTLTNLITRGITVKAAVDAANGKFYIPNQVITRDTTNKNNVDICYFTISSGKAVIDRTRAITGTINADGTLQIDDYWGSFAADGKIKDGVYDAWSNTLFTKANGKLVYTANGNTYAYDVALYHRRIS